MRKERLDFEFCLGTLDHCPSAVASLEQLGLTFYFRFALANLLRESGLDFLFG